MTRQLVYTVDIRRGGVLLWTWCVILGDGTLTSGSAWTLRGARRRADAALEASLAAVARLDRITGLRTPIIVARHNGALR